MLCTRLPVSNSPETSYERIEVCRLVVSLYPSIVTTGSRYLLKQKFRFLAKYGICFDKAYHGTVANR